ncbi:MAG: hypothetical protein ACE5JA_03130 [bacterium]
MAGWRDRLSSVHCTLGFVAVVGAAITVTFVLAERGILDPRDWEVSPSQWWGIPAAHFANRDFAHYLGNMTGLFLFGGLFTAASLVTRKFHTGDIIRRFDSRLPWIVLGSALVSSLWIWYVYLLEGRGSGVGTSTIVSAAFGGGAWLYIAIALGGSGSSKDGSHGRAERRKGRIMALFFAGLFIVFFLYMYGLLGSMSAILTHWVSFSLSVFGSWLAFPRTHKAARVA